MHGLCLPCTKERPCEHMTIWKRMLIRNMTMLVTWFFTSSLQSSLKDMHSLNTQLHYFIIQFLPLLALTVNLMNFRVVRKESSEWGIVHSIAYHLDLDFDMIINWGRRINDHWQHHSSVSGLELSKKSR